MHKTDISETEQVQEMALVRGRKVAVSDCKVEMEKDIPGKVGFSSPSLVFHLSCFHLDWIYNTIVGMLVTIL